MALLLGLLAAPGGAAPPQEDPVEALEAGLEQVREVQNWVRRARRTRAGLHPDDLATLSELVAEVEGLRRSQPALRTEVDTALIQLAGLRYESLTKTPEGIRATWDVADLGRRRLDERLDRDSGAFASWLADTVLAAEQAPEPERLVAAALLEGRYLRSTRAALLRVARTADGDLRRLALEALVGWADPVVDAFFLDQLEEDGRGISTLSRHLEAVAGQLEPVLVTRVRDTAGRLYLSEDWRDAARARHLVRALEVRDAAPLLLEALASWQRRAGDGDGSRRIVGEIVAELQRISGRSIGPSLERWSAWWTAVQEGDVDLPDDILEEGGFVSLPSFFGLEAETDRVMFVVDLSGSMARAFSTDGRSRYEEAIDQLIGFVRDAGEETRFGITLFNDGGLRWQSALARTGDRSLGRARKWLERHEPEGGTNLLAGLREGLRLDRSGRLDPDRVDVDTVIVLCDGATAQGPEWAGDWLAAQNETAMLVFHCVEIGNQGVGTLEALAAGSGGTFLRVQ